MDLETEIMCSRGSAQTTANRSMCEVQESTDKSVQKVKSGRGGKDTGSKAGESIQKTHLM